MKVSIVNRKGKVLVDEIQLKSTDAKTDEIFYQIKEKLKCFLRPDLVYGKTFNHSAVQSIAYLMVMVHFIKREWETLFVHRFR